MSIKPIDLQQLFTQMDQVAREQRVAHNGATVLKAVLGDQAALEEAAKAETVEKAEDAGHGSEAVKDRQRRREHPAGEKGKGDGENPEKAAGEPDSEEVVRDPALGGKIDISG